MLPTKSIYTRGAEDGAWMGLLFVAAATLQTAAHGALLPTLLADILLLAVPVLLWAMLRRSYRYDRCLTTFSGLWMHGIMIFLCGSLILGLVAFIYMRFINPGFIYAQARQAVELYSQVPDFQTFAQTLQKAIDRKLLPSPITITFTIIWLGGFSGAMLSLIEAAIIKATVKK